MGGGWVASGGQVWSVTPWTSLGSLDPGGLGGSRAGDGERGGEGG